LRILGDVLISNHPKAGGSHLPDITIMRPIFIGNKVCFWTAARGHHADIGGIAPGSIPANSKYLWEEGTCIEGFKIVTEANGFDEDTIIRSFLEDPASFPNCSGARKFADTLSDLTAQIGATSKGEVLLLELFREFGTCTIEHYMDQIRKNAQNLVKKFLYDMFKSQKSLWAEDFMDDGSRIALKIYKDEEKNLVVFDFEGTSPCVYGNWNAPLAISNSAVIYCLRCLINKDIPLNAGVLDSIIIKRPEGSLLNPPHDVAVVGGNVLTSQRIVDVILKAFSIEPQFGFAASHGCCNNLCFGEEEFGFYETIGGGSGASYLGNGASGVHCHMTNTRITDVEVIEKRYPVILRQFSIREGSGGKGYYKGGDGIIRKIEFAHQMPVSISSERRTFEPNGLFGGEPGARGVNLWYRSKDGTIINLGGKAQFTAQPGDVLEIYTAGGGGYLPQNL
jgi:5-oxoprolinase (ATP-hydrolysing)